MPSPPPSADFVDSAEPTLPKAGSGVRAVSGETLFKAGDRVADNIELVSVLDHRDTHTAMAAERAFAHRLGGSCQSPIAAHARLEGKRLTLDGLVAEPDGSRLLRDTLSGSVDEPAALGRQLAERILAAGAGPLLERLRAG